MTGSLWGVDDGRPYVLSTDDEMYYLHPKLPKAPWFGDGADVEFKIDHNGNVVSLTVSPREGTIKRLAFGKKANWTADFDGKSINTPGELEDADENTKKVLAVLNSRGDEVVWAVVPAKGVKLPEWTVRVEGVPPASLRGLSSEQFSQFSTAYQEMQTCEKMTFNCPGCEGDMPLSCLDEGCTKCGWTLPDKVGEVEPFRPVYDEDGHSITFQEYTWVCPVCQAVVAVYDEGEKKRCPNGHKVPEPFYFSSELDEEEYQLRYTAKSTLNTKVDASKMTQLLASATGHISTREVIDLGDQGFDTAKASYNSGGCPHCKTGKACGSSVPGNNVKSFSQFYYLDDQSSRRTQNRLRELKLVLDGLPKCTCADDRKLKAIPRAPFNVFRTFGGEIDPEERHWNGSKQQARTLRTKHLKDAKKEPLYFDVILKKDNDKNMQCHTTPRSAGGCFLSGGNVIPIREFCPTCQCLDELFTLWQGENAENWDEQEYVARFVATREELQDRSADRYLKAREEKEEKIKTWVADIKKSLPKTQ